jgi:hypothetical protein
MRHATDDRRTMRRFAGVVAAIAIAVVCPVRAGAQAAGKYDGSVRMLCVPVTVVECADGGPDGECKRRTPAGVNLPQFLSVDVKAMTIQAEGGGRQSPVRNLEHLNGVLILQGGQDGRGWTLTISEETGRMSGAVTTDGEGFIVFGACTLP